MAVLSIGVNLAEPAWKWAWVFGFGAVMPALLLRQVGRLLTPQSKRSLPSAKDKEKELLEVLGERGELTPVTAAMRTSLTADEAAEVLEELARKGYLRLGIEDGLQVYALWKQDRRGLTETDQGAPEQDRGGGEAPQPLDDPLSERELEVLGLLASGRTNSEIARDFSSPSVRSNLTPATSTVR